MTHAELVARAARWLRNTLQCRLVLTEFRACTAEQPDAIGWGNWEWNEETKWGGVRCINVECKVSRADFFHDQKKTHRQSDGAMGSRRWYMTPAGMVLPEEVPHGWGLAEVKNNKVFRTIEAPLIMPAERNYDGEVVTLLSAAQGLSESWIRNCREAMNAPALDPCIDAEVV